MPENMKSIAVLTEYTEGMRLENILVLIVQRIMGVLSFYIKTNYSGELQSIVPNKLMQVY